MPSVQPSLRDLCRCRRIPGVETPGYYRVVPLGRTRFLNSVWDGRLGQLAFEFGKLMKKTLAMVLVVATMFAAKTMFSQKNATVFKLDDETKGILRDATADNWFKKEAFTSALLGAATAIGAAWVAFLWQRRNEQRAERAFNQLVLDAIRIELKTLIDIYDSGKAGKIKDLKDGETFPYWLHFSQRHFIVFESNASHVGKIDPELAAQIIKVYEIMKVFVEAMGVNSYCVRDLDQVAWALKQTPNDTRLIERQQGNHLS